MNDREIFANALQKETDAERAAYLDEACAGDAEMRGRIEELLQEKDDLGSFLESPARGAGALPTLDQPITEKPGTTIGRYKLLEQIGEGGFGVVFMAEQEEPVRRKVALKIIKPGMDTREVIARFEAERQALAIMDHPNIAKVLDAGATESGRPFFVMELVRGVPITQFCDQHSLTAKERLQLFVSVCQAVQHAHQKGIIHRDIKPSNVLVTLRDDQPVPKVIDFGVAKATNQRLTEKTVFTRFAQMIGTPLYMSPEQAGMSELDIDTRSDIYSLGVLLYELLTGTTPFDHERFREAAYDELLRIIREEEPPRPSLRISTLGDTLPSVAAYRKTEPKKLSTLVRGELDWIVMKALEKDRTRRYETANGFAADVQRYLSDEPVEACPPSAAYRFKKFARRNEVALVTTAAVLLCLLAGIVGTSWQANCATTAMNRALAAEQLAQERLAAEETARKEAEQARGAESEQRATAERERDRAEKNLELATTERQRAEGNLDLALAALDAVYLEAIGKDKLLGEPTAQSDDEEIMFIAPPPLNDLERELLQRGLNFYDQFAGKNADADRVSVQAAHAFYRVGLLQGAIGDREAAQAAYREAIKRFERLTVEEPNNPAHFINLADAYRGLANVLPDWSNAKKELEKARGALSKAIEIEPDRVEYYLLRSEISAEMSDFEQEKVDIDNALTLAPDNVRALKRGVRLWLYRDAPKALALAERCVGLAPKDPAAHLSYAEALGQSDAKVVIDVATISPNKTLSLEHFARAIELAPDDNVAFIRRGRFYSKVGELHLAIADFTRAFELRPDEPEALTDRGIAYKSLGNYDQARADLETYLQFRPHDGRAYEVIGATHLEQGNWQAAVDAFSKALEISPISYTVRKRRSAAYLKLEKYEEALADVRAALEMHPEDTSALWMIRSSANTDLTQTPEHFQQALLEIAADAVEQSPKPALAYADRGFLCYHLENYDQAEADFARAVRLEPPCDFAWRYWGYVYMARSMPKEACEKYSQAIEADPGDWENWRSRGNANLQLQDWPAAIRDFSKVLELHPSNHAALAQRAIAHQRMGELDKAIDDYTRSIQISPTAEAYAGRAGVYLRKKEMDKAQEDLVASADQSRGSVLGWLRLLDVAIADGASPERIQDIIAEANTKLDEQYALDCLFQYAASCLWSHQHDEYEKACRDATERQGESKNLRTLYTKSRLGALASEPVIETEQLVRMATEAADLYPAPWRQHALGLCLLRDGQTKAAIDQFNRSLDQSWDAAVVNWLGLAIATASDGQSEEAREFLQKAREWCKNNPLDLASTLHPHDRIACQLLLREAEQLIEPTSNPETTSVKTTE